MDTLYKYTCEFERGVPDYDSGLSGYAGTQETFANAMAAGPVRCWVEIRQTLTQYGNLPKDADDLPAGILMGWDNPTPNQRMLGVERKTFTDYPQVDNRIHKRIRKEYGMHTRAAIVAEEIKATNKQLDDLLGWGRGKVRVIKGTLERYPVDFSQLSVESRVEWDCRIAFTEKVTLSEIKKIMKEMGLFNGSVFFTAGKTMSGGDRATIYGSDLSIETDYMGPARLIGEDVEYPDHVGVDDFLFLKEDYVKMTVSKDHFLNTLLYSDLTSSPEDSDADNDNSGGSDNSEDSDNPFAFLKEKIKS